MITLVSSPVWTSYYGDLPEIHALQSILTRDSLEDLEKPVELYSEDKFLTGLIYYVIRELTKRHIEVGFTPDIPVNVPIITKDFLEGVTMRDYQVKAVNDALSVGRCIIKMATGSGKSEIYAAIVRALDTPSLCIVGKVNQAMQMLRRVNARGLTDVGVLGGDSDERMGKHIIAVSNSLYSGIKRNDEEILRLLSDCQVLFFDEAHHASAHSWLSIATRCENATYRYGLSATPFEKDDPYEDPRDMLLTGITGEVAVDVSSLELRALGYLAQPVVHIIPIMHPQVSDKIDNWSVINNLGVVCHGVRNNVIANLVYNIVRNGGKPLVIVAIIEHGDNLLRLLYERGVNAVFSHGGGEISEHFSSGIQVRNESEEWVADTLNGNNYDALIGSVVVDEGVDIPIVSDIILAGAGRKSRRLLQRIGRGMRMFKGKNSVQVWDFFDGHHPSLKYQSYHRGRVYRSEKFTVLRGYDHKMTGFPNLIPVVSSKVL